MRRAGIKKRIGPRMIAVVCVEWSSIPGRIPCLLVGKNRVEILGWCFRLQSVYKHVPRLIVPQSLGW